MTENKDRTFIIIVLALLLGIMGTLLGVEKWKSVTLQQVDQNDKAMSQKIQADGPNHPFVKEDR